MNHPGWCVLAALGWACGGCTPDGAPARDAGEAPPAAQVIRRGPVQLSVGVQRDHITIADPIHLTIEAQAPAGIEVDLPQFGDRLNEFTIRNARNVPAVPDGTLRRWRQEYDLEIYVSGEHTIPAIEVTFVDHRGSDPQQGQLASEPITVQVDSLIEGAFDPAQFRDIKGAVELPAAPRPFPWGWAAGGGSLVAAAALLLWRWRRRGPATAAPILPHVWALRELQLLDDCRLCDQGEVREYYFRLSRIVRDYIERRFEVMACEQTTAEFLQAMGRAPVLAERYRDLLQDFLQACDLVKFARYEPPGGEVAEARRTAQDFVEQTTDRAAPPREAAA